MGWWYFVSAEVTALVVSVLSLIIAALAMGWNVYRDVVLKPRLKVRVAVVQTIVPGVGATGKYVNVAGTNHGPGAITVQQVYGTDVGRIRRLLGDKSGFIVINPSMGELPCRLDVGETVNLMFPYDRDVFIRNRAKRLGLIDSFDKWHSAKRSELRAAHKSYLEDFGRDAAHG